MERMFSRWIQTSLGLVFLAVLSVNPTAWAQEEFTLGPDDACFVAGANWQKGSGYMVTWGQLSAVQKEIIEASKVDECAFGFIGRCIWHFVHHTPIHLWGGGPLWGYDPLWT